MGLLDSYKGSVDPVSFNRSISDKARVPGAYNANTGANSRGVYTYSSSGISSGSPYIGGSARSSISAPSSIPYGMQPVGMYTGGSSGPGYMPPAYAAPAAPVYAPPMPQGPPPKDLNAINSYVDNQIASQLNTAKTARDSALQAGKTSSTQQLGSLQTQFDRTRELIGSERALQNNRFERVVGPTTISGAAAYQESMLNREREISDRQAKEDLATRQANVNQNLTDMENSLNSKYQALQDSTGAEKERLVREIQKDERDYQIALRGENRADILANATVTRDEFTRKQTDFQNQRLAEQDAYKQKQDAILQEERSRAAHINEATNLEQRYGVSVTPTNDYSLMLQQVAGLQPVAAQKLALDAKQMGFENAIKKALAENTISNSQAQLALSKASQGLQQDKFNYDKDPNNPANQPKARGIGDITKEIDGSTFITKDPDTGRQVVYDPVGLEKYILSLNLPADQTRQMYLRYNLPLK